MVNTKNRSPDNHIHTQEETQLYLGAPCLQIRAFQRVLQATTFEQELFSAQDDWAHQFTIWSQQNLFAASMIVLILAWKEWTLQTKNLHVVGSLERVNPPCFLIGSYMTSGPLQRFLQHLRPESQQTAGSPCKAGARASFDGGDGQCLLLCDNGCWMAQGA